MPSYVVLRQSHTDPSTFDPAKGLLRQGQMVDERGGEEIPEFEALSLGAFGTATFERAAKFLADALEQDREVIALVDEVDATRLNPLANYGWSSLIAMLILAFPEVRWVFQVVHGKPPHKNPEAEKDETEEQRKERKRLIKTLDDRRDMWQAVHHSSGAQTLLDPRGTALFDGYGMRQRVRAWMRIEHDGGDSLGSREDRDFQSMPCRPNLAVVLDDECDYSWFLALTAYGRGFRVHAISSWAEARALLGEEGALLKDSVPKDSPKVVDNFLLSIEDWYLNFPDQGSEHGISDLNRRSEVLPGLRTIPPPRRRFVTVGHERNRPKARMRNHYLANLRTMERAATGVKVRKAKQRVLKPAAGFFTLWSDLGLKQAFPNLGLPRICRGLAPGFLWPPKAGVALPSLDVALEEPSGGHSSPGRLLQIAEHLLHRASAMIENVNSVTEAVRGAILATQALEVLGCRTPTLSVNALALKHQFEILVECHFVGVEYHLTMKERLADIRENLKAMSRWLHRDRRRAFILNSEALILTHLVRLLDRYGEFEESELCQYHLRLAHRRISEIHERRNQKVFKMLLWPLNWYSDWVTYSLARFVGAIALFVIIAATLMSLAIGVNSNKEWIFSFPDGLHNTVSALLGGNLPDPDDDTWPVTILGYLAAAFGLLNLGLFVTHLYSKLVRKP